MERQIIDLDDKTFILINGPLIFFNLTANIFYARCLIFPPCNRQRVKQPLKMLLGFLVWCSTMYSVSLALVYVLLMVQNSFEVSWIILMYFVHTSMTCSVWLNFYYYSQIVPSQQAILIWVKRNIRSVIYVILFLDMMFFWFKGTVTIIGGLFPVSFTSHINGTWTEMIDHHTKTMNYVMDLYFYLNKVYTLFCLCIMTVSIFSMVCYLQRHIKSMAQGGGSFSTPRIQSQKRVTTTGISQGVFFILYGTFYYFDALTYRYSKGFHFGAWIAVTAATLYISVTTVNLGIGQSIFRQRAADTWKALKAVCGVGMVKNDVKVYSSQLTLGEF